MKSIGVLSFLVLATSIVSAESVKHEFKQPHKQKYAVEPSAFKRGEKWLPAKAEGSTNTVELGHRVVIQVEPGSNVNAITRGVSLKKDREISPDVYVFEAADAVTALQEAEALAKHPKVRAAYPIARESAVLDGAFAPLPNDIFFYRFLSTGGTNGIYGQWCLENRTFEGTQMGADIAIRSAWPYSRGSNVVIAVADSGIELTHQELRNPTTGAPHHNFADGTTNVIPATDSLLWVHGTMVAGIIAAEANNNQGMAGIAHEAKLAAWTIFGSNSLLVSEEKLMDMYQFSSNVVSVQNHSWGKGGSLAIKPMGILESIGFSNAIVSGRNGLGSIIVRSAGNDRFNSRSSNDRGETASPWAITVGAAGYHGRVATYSENSAAVLVSAPSGDVVGGSPNLFTTDFVGTRGKNFLTYFGDPHLNAYGFNGSGFDGTSGSAPQIAGIGALILSANPLLSYRDVQQILIHSARQWDTEDPDLKTNAAGFRVSHNLGFGIPNAGEAVRLARNWTSRPALTNISIRSTNVVAVPDAGLRVIVSGDNLPSELASIIAEPTQRGPHPDSPTSAVPLVDIGAASNAIPQDLSGHGAVSPRDATGFSTKINNAAAAGAAFTIICNNSTNRVFAMAGTDFTKIPAVCIPKSDGETLRAYMSNNVATAKLELQSATYTFNVTNSLSCEHVGLQIKSDHPQRGDLRITLTSPQGTRSVLQFLNPDTNPIPGTWTYYSTHHFYENSAGTWTAAITDEVEGGSGSVLEVELVVLGTEIDDIDHDGMSDSWELAQFGDLSAAASTDLDQDGYNNLRERIIGTNPQQANAPLSLDLARFNSGYYRASWPSSTDFNYEVWSGTDLGNMTVLTNIPGGFPESDWVFSATNSGRFLRVVQKAK